MSSAGKAAYPASSMDSRRLNQPEQIAAVLKVYWTGVGITLLAGSHKCHKYQKYVYIYIYIHIYMIHNARICSLEAPKRYNKHKQSDSLCTGHDALKVHSQTTVTFPSFLIVLWQVARGSVPTQYFRKKLPGPNVIRFSRTEMSHSLWCELSIVASAQVKMLLRSIYSHMTCCTCSFHGVF